MLLCRAIDRTCACRPTQGYMVRPRQKRRRPAADQPAVQGVDPAHLANQVVRLPAVAEAARAVDRAKAPNHEFLVVAAIATSSQPAPTL